jgi:hypothetical protein
MPSGLNVSHVSRYQPGQEMLQKPNTQPTDFPNSMSAPRPQNVLGQLARSGSGLLSVDSPLPDGARMQHEPLKANNRRVQSQSVPQPQPETESQLQLDSEPKSDRIDSAFHRDLCTWGAALPGPPSDACFNRRQHQSEAQPSVPTSQAGQPQAVAAAAAAGVAAEEEEEEEEEEEKEMAEIAALELELTRRKTAEIAQPIASAGDRASQVGAARSTADQAAAEHAEIQLAERTVSRGRRAAAHAATMQTTGAAEVVQAKVMAAQQISSRAGAGGNSAGSARPPPSPLPTPKIEGNVDTLMRASRFASREEWEQAAQALFVRYASDASHGRHETRDHGETGVSRMELRPAGFAAMVAAVANAS